MVRKQGPGTRDAGTSVRVGESDSCLSGYSFEVRVRNMTETATRPQLAYLTGVLDELKAKGTHFKLRVLDDQQAPVCHYDGKRSDQPCQQ